MRAVVFSVAILIASPATAAMIRIGGNFDLDSHPTAKFIFTGGDGNVVGSKFFLDQLPLEQRHEFTVPAGELYWVNLFNQTRYLAGDSARASQWHFGEFLSGAPNAYQNAGVIEMIGGDVVDLGGGMLAQNWTYIVDGGAPEAVQVRMIPEPGTRGLVCLAWAVVVSWAGDRRMRPA